MLQSVVWQARLLFRLLLLQLLQLSSSSSSSSNSKSCRRGCRSRSGSKRRSASTDKTLVQGAPVSGVGAGGGSRRTDEITEGVECKEVVAQRLAAAVEVVTAVARVRVRVRVGE